MQTRRTLSRVQISSLTHLVARMRCTRLTRLSRSTGSRESLQPGMAASWLFRAGSKMGVWRQLNRCESAEWLA